MNTESNAEDIGIIKKVLGKDKQAFAALVDKYKNPVYNLAFRMTGSRFDADDVAQETFIKAYRNLKSFRQDLNFFSWLYSIALNTARNWLKAGKTPVRCAAAADPEHIADTKPGTDAKMSSNQEIEGMLGILPEKYRAAFVLKHLENYTCEEISKMLKCPEGTVRVRIHRAKQMLYERFKGT
ncbi:hypothetical protein AUJ67_02190 [Candidatus Desantisbacteria bacterium CG1_02_49_89]|nr:MAG: hypothetical protein AUJ67_02190 [Candidatus Desantisbacteria bacterium CG1_02_49_89]